MMVLGMIVFFVITGLLFALSLCKFHIDTYKWEVANLTVRINDLTEGGNSAVAEGRAWKDAALEAREKVANLQAQRDSWQRAYIRSSIDLMLLENSLVPSRCPMAFPDSAK